MDAETIKSFLVGLGFGVDEKSLERFNKAIVSASVKVAALYVGIETAAAGIFLGISKISEGFEDMGYQLRLVAPAINKMLILRQAMIDAYTAAGIHLTKAVQQSILFNYSLAKTKFALEAVYKSVGIKFLPLLTQQMDIFRAKIFTYMPKIQDQLTSFVNFIFKAFDATVQFGSRVWEILGKVYEGFQKLDTITGGWSTKILGFIAIWKYLNLSFLTTPFGMVIAGITALIALYDDFKVWQEGGEAFINWGSRTTHMILGITAAVAGLTAAVGAVIGVIKLVTAAQVLWNIALTLNPIGLIIAGVTALLVALTALAYKFGFLKGIGDKFASLGDKVVGAFGGPGAANQIANTLGSPGAGPALNTVLQPSPLTQQGAGTSQKVSQETSIVVQGSADANAVGKAVANEQNKVNFDMTRNLKGAIKQ